METTFKTNVVVYKLEEIGDGKTTAELVRRSTDKYPDTMYMNLYETHYPYIHDIGMYCHSYRCRKCGNSLWKTQQHLLRHERTCEAGVNRMYKGGVYRPPPSIFQRLDDEGIVVAPVLRYYPYRATFDFECYFDRDNVPADTDHVQWVARDVPLSVSLASNVPGYEPAQCFVTDGDADKLVADMMTRLNTISDAAFASLLPLYADVLADLNTRSRVFRRREKRKRSDDGGDDGDDVMNERTSDDDDDDDDDMDKRLCKWRKTADSGDDVNATLMGKLFAWLQQLPVIGFNSGRYDLNAIKRFFVPLLIRNNATERASCFVIKRQNNFMCLTTDKFKFVDICNYLAPGFSYAKYLAAYGCAQQKGHFPYEYMDDLRKLDERALPPQAAFFSRITNEGISDDDYARCQAVWCANEMKTLREYLVWYNNRDVTPFLEAIVHLLSSPGH